MAKIQIPCLVARTNKAGVTSWYWQPSKTLRASGWEPVALGKDRAAAMRAAEERNAQVERWKASGERVARVKPHAAAGTVAALVARYRKDVVNGVDERGRPRLADKTKETYETALKRIVAWAGKHPLAYVTPARVTELKKIIARPVDQAGGLGHAAAYNMLKTLRQVFAFAERIDAIPKGSNPATGFELGAPPPRNKVWEAADEAAFIAAAYDLGLPSMALAVELALYTAQREHDLIAMTEGQICDLEIFDPVLVDRLGGRDGTVRGWRFTQHKNQRTFVTMEIPLETKILAKIDAALRVNRARDRALEPPVLQSHVLVYEGNGRPYAKRHFIRIWTKVLEHAAKAAGRPGMVDLVWHDLRRTRVVRLRRRGMPKEMIASITGTSPASIEAMLKVYGPIDPTITANAIASTLEPASAPENPSNKEASEA